MFLQLMFDGHVVCTTEIYFEDALLDEVKGSCAILHFGFLTLRGVQHEILVPTFLLAVRAQW